MFADHLEVELTIIVPDSLSDLLEGINNKTAHLAAAGLTITEPRKKLYKFGPEYQSISEQLIYNRRQHRPKNLGDLRGGLLEVVAQSSHTEHLIEHQQKYPDLSWKENEELESEELLQLVADGVIDYTIADSNEATLNKRFLLNLRTAFDTSPPQQLAWALPKDKDTSLLDAVGRFFEQINNNGELTRLIERSYGHVDKLSYVGTIFFRRHVKKQLPKYQKMFIQAAEEHNLDWRLLAAIGYQESHWNPEAVSPTGVRGIMMLTQRTAAHLGIKNRLDPESSIKGGAKYIASRLKHIPKSILEPDRTWLALAAYNVGPGHLEDARIITEKLDKDPDKWIDVKQALPLLAQRKWYKKTKHGYARGREPVKYVDNIRSYYDVLRWLDEDEEGNIQEPDALSIVPQIP
jgi:membrane-bound lytic murein transglycosylase F